MPKEEEGFEEMIDAKRALLWRDKWAETLWKSNIWEREEKGSARAPEKKRSER